MKKLALLIGQRCRFALALGGCFGLALGAARAQAPAVCLPPTGVVVGSVTATSATFSFVSDPAATMCVLVQPQVGNGILMPGATSPVMLVGLVPNMPYTVCVASICGNGVSSNYSCATPFRTVLGTVGAALTAQVGLFPNPATGSFTLRLPAALSRPAATATLCNALGQVVLTQPLASRTDGPDTRFDVRGLAPGVYVLRLPTPAGVVAKRVVLE